MDQATRLTIRTTASLVRHSPRPAAAVLQRTELFPKEYMCGSDAKLISATLFELEAEDLRIDAANAPKPKPGAAHPRKKATKSKAVQKEAPVIERAEGMSSLLSDYVKQRKVLVAQMLVDGNAEIGRAHV